MKNLSHSGFILLATLLIFSGCSGQKQTAAPTSDAQPSGAHLTEAQVISIAKRTAKQRGIKFSECEEPKASYESKLKSWIVFFDYKVSNPDEIRVSWGFTVFVNDQTQQAQFMGSM